MKKICKDKLFFLRKFINPKGKILKIRIITCVNNQPFEKIIKTI